MKKMIKVSCLFLLISIFCHGAEDINTEGVVVWDAQTQFSDTIFKAENVEMVYSDNKPVYLALTKKRPVVDAQTDLYLTFDKYKGRDFLKNYKIAYKQFRFNETSSIINESGYFFKDEDRLELAGNSRSFFQPGINLSSFVISFWIFPLSFSNYDVILRIGSQYYDDNTDIIEEQSIVVRMEEGRVFWEFNNLFSSNNLKKDIIRLESYDRVIPNKWSHITLKYDQYSGKIEIYINGIQSALALATVDGTINSSILNLRYHKKNRSIINLAPIFSGSLDEFLITRSIHMNGDTKYQGEGGVLISNVRRIDNMGGTVTNVDIQDITKNNSDILYYCRYSETPFYSDDAFSQNVPWVPLKSENLNDIRMKYFQWKAVFLPGKDNEHSPRFKKMVLHYRKDMPPAPPKGIRILEGDGKVKLKWLMNSEKDLKGYKIYYGTKSNHYFGTDALEGSSPIDVGKINEVEITGLKNNVIYYFVLTAYDDEDKNHESAFSNEVFARPLEEAPK